MSETEVVSTAPETLNPAPIAAETPETAAPEATDTAAPEEQVPEAKPEKTAEQKELEYLRRKATKADRNNARMYQELEQLRQRVPQDTQQTEAPAQVDPYKLAAEIAAVEKINAKSNDIAKDGQKRFAESWAKSLSTVIDEAGPLIDPKTYRPTALGDAILDSDDPAALVHHLGTNPDLADELADLTPAQLGRRIAKIEAAMGVKAAKPVSNAPKPISPIQGGSSAVNVDLEKASMDEYRAARAKQGARWAR